MILCVKGLYQSTSYGQIVSIPMAMMSQPSDLLAVVLVALYIRLLQSSADRQMCINSICRTKKAGEEERG